MKRAVGILLLLILLAFGLPALFSAIESIIIPAIIVIAICGVGILMFQRKRLW